MSQLIAAVLLTCLHYGSADCPDRAIGGVDTLHIRNESLNILNKVCAFYEALVTLCSKTGMFDLFLSILVVFLMTTDGFQKLKAFSFDVNLIVLAFHIKTKFWECS